MNLAVNAVAKKRSRTLLPLLVVLFLISYSLLTMMVVQQSRTINSQRSLIHLLFKDNVHLSALRKGQPVYGHATAEQNATKTPNARIPVIQVPQEKGSQSKGSQNKADQGGSSKYPKEQAALKNDRRAHKAQRHTPKPPVDLTDPSDTRRVSSAI